MKGRLSHEAGLLILLEICWQKMRRICRAEATRATLQAVKQRFPTLSTPESTGKADFPHDLEKGALQRRGSHIATRGRKSLDRELQKVDTSLSQAVEVD